VILTLLVRVSGKGLVDPHAPVRHLKRIRRILPGSVLTALAPVSANDFNAGVALEPDGDAVRVMIRQ
jgi:hypothetical protein